MKQVRFNICTLPEYRDMVHAYNTTYEAFGETSITKNMRAAVTFLCNFHQMSFSEMAAGDVNSGKADQPYDLRYTDVKGKLQIITDNIYMS